MEIRLSEKKIIDRCGLAAFNRGKQFFHKGNVSMLMEREDFCKAVVHGIEDFHVEIHKTDNGFKSSCSCPTLASFSKDCQHIAAVLHLLLGRQTNDIFDVFQNENMDKFTALTYFETRKLLDIQFIIKITKENNLALLIKIEGQQVDNINVFLRSLHSGKNFYQDGKDLYDFNKHCFSKESSLVLEKLIAYDSYGTHEGSIVIPPLLWTDIFPLIERKPFVNYMNHENQSTEIIEEKSVLPLRFSIHSIEARAQLKINGLEKLTLLPGYGFVIYDGLFYQLTSEAMRQLIDLNSLLDEYHALSIPEDQLFYFSEKIIPKLQGFGEVKIAKEMLEKFELPELKAKLFLDRVNQRLLASLEFHYDYFVIHPSEETGDQNFAIRDYEKENLILEMMESAKFYQTDGGYILHNEELEYAFLMDVLPNLEKHVEIFATTAVRNRILPQPTKPKIKIKQHKDRLDWLEFKFEMEGFVEKEIKEILQAVEEKRRYYRLKSGALLSLETKEMKEIHDFLQQAPFKDDAPDEFETTVVEGLKLIDIFTDESMMNPEISLKRFFQKTTNPNIQEIQIPENLNAELRDYQKVGLNWMNTLSSYGFGGVLADDMGLGKTLQSIAYIASRLTAIRENDEQILIVCPSAVLYHWQNECNQFLPEATVAIIDGTKEIRGEKLSHIRKHDVIITTYTMLRSDIDWYKKWKFNTIFYDEAQAFKNPRTQTARALKKLQATTSFALTGTPMENNIDELWSIFHIVFPELFGSYESFRHLTKRKINRRIRPFMLRRMKHQVANELPEKIEQVEVVELSPDQKKIYAAYLAKLKKEELKHLDKETLDKNRIKILAGLTRLRQICCHPSLFVEDYNGNSAKLERLLSIIQEAKRTNRRILIFSQFTSMLKIIARNLAETGTSFFYLDGATESQERQRLSKKFNEGEKDIFLISLKAGGTGLNLTGADTVILYDLWWNPAVEEQAADRAYRIGQKNTVHVIKLIAKGTIEEKMNQLQERKRKLIREVIDSNIDIAKGLSLTDIKEIFAD
ncbi:DEAD/DEAH box helicase [Oceanobacillus sp. CAU 1775]